MSMLPLRTAEIDAVTIAQKQPLLAPLYNILRNVLLAISCNKRLLLFSISRLPLIKLCPIFNYR